MIKPIATLVCKTLNVQGFFTPIGHFTIDQSDYFLGLSFNHLAYQILEKGKNGNLFQFPR